MNKIFVFLLCALLFEACVWLRKKTYRVVKIRKMPDLRHHALGGVVVSLLGVGACLLILQERRSYSRFRDEAIELGLKVISEQCDSKHNICDDTTNFKTMRDGIVIIRRTSNGNVLSVGVSRNPLGIYVKR